MQGDEESIGGIVKRDGRVIATRVGRGSQPDVNCRVENFGQMVSGFDSTKRRWVKEMGFASLLSIAGKRLPRSLCYWLMTKVDPNRKSLFFSEEIEIPLNSRQVRWVFGIPGGSLRVPSGVWNNDTMQAAVDKFVCKYRVFGKESKTTYIPRDGLFKVVEKPEVQEADFKEAFLAIVLCDILCPTTSPRVASDLMPAITVYGNAASYDWASFALEKLFGSACSFADRFYRDGVAMHCGGCTYFLAVSFFFY